MKKLFIMSILTVFTSLLGCAQEPSFKSVEVSEFEQIISNPEIIRLDVRRADEYAEGQLENTLNIDVLKNDFKELALQKLDKNKTIALYCRSGRRSKQAAQILIAEGYTIIELNTGYMGWTGAGKPTVK